VENLVPLAQMEKREIKENLELKVNKET